MYTFDRKTSSRMDGWIYYYLGEGCFFIKLNKGRNKVGVGVQLVFQVAQHIRDESLLKSFIAFFKCGHYVKPLNQEWGYFQCTKLSDNYNIIIPFCSKYPPSIRGVKAKDFCACRRRGGEIG